MQAISFRPRSPSSSKYLRLYESSQDSIFRGGSLCRRVCFFFYAVTRIDVDNKGITDLTGVRYFSNLEYLNCSRNNLGTLVLTDLTKLVELNCWKCELTVLSAGGFNAWVNVLNNGASKQDVIEGFAQSPEFTRICASYGIIR